MTELTVTLPDELAKKAEATGLLSSEGIERALRGALKREAGHRFLEIAKDLQSGDSSPISEEEIQAEIDAVRAARRAKHGVPSA
ncbi:MAG: hypothetical protein ACREVC_11095 [Burkholderiales bacterium]